MSRKIDLYRKEIGERIHQVRQAAGMTQAAFAKRVGSSQPSIVRFESGARMPDALVVTMIAEEFGCHLVWLLTGEGESGLN